MARTWNTLGAGARHASIAGAAIAAIALASGCGGGSPAASGGQAAAAQSASDLLAGCVNPNGVKVIEKGHRPAGVFATVEANEAWRECAGRGGGAASSELSYQGGTADGAASTVGVEVSPGPLVYLVFWGSQWSGNDPNGEASILQGFFQGVGGSSWANDDTQYCQGVAAGTVYCNGSGVPAGNASGTLAGYWYDGATAAPTHPRQSDLANEAIHAASHFGNLGAGSNAAVQYVIATATGNSSSGFGHQFCAWHSSTSSPYGDISYTNLPYITDAGASCGAGFNGLGPNAGITIVEGHEFAETVTDPLPSGGWVDAGGAETGDKCAWIRSGNQGAAADITLSTGTFAVQSLWSNAFDSGVGGCVLAYP